MKKLLAALAVSVLAFVVSRADAATGTVNLSWTNPTTYVDGTPLPAAAIAETQAYCDFTPTGSTNATPCASAAPAAFAGSVSSGVQTFTYPPQGGKACWYVRTRVGVAVSDPASPVACKDFAPIKPNAPSNVTVTVTLTLNMQSDSPISVAMSAPVVAVAPQ